MIQRIDFSESPQSGLQYSGSEQKAGVLYLNRPFMLKFRKKNIYGECFNDIAEYIGSHVFGMLGIPAQETLLGTYKGEKVVACLDFNCNGFKFVPFNDLGESTIDGGKGNFRYSYQKIQDLISKNRKLKEKEAAALLFWKTYIVDALLANPDRHGKNWGFLKKDDQYFVAPVFDNGSSLFSNFSDEEEMLSVLRDKEEIKERVYQRPTSLVLYSESISDYYSVISSLEFELCNKALIEVFPKIKLKRIFGLIDETDLSDTKKRFLKTIVQARYEKILSETYEKVRKR